MDAALTAPRGLSGEEAEELREMLRALLLVVGAGPEDEQDAESLIEYAMVMLEGGEDIGHIVEELQFMEMPMCDEEVAESLGIVLTKFFQELEKSDGEDEADVGTPVPEADEVAPHSLPSSSHSSPSDPAPTPECKRRSWTDELLHKTPKKQKPEHELSTISTSEGKSWTERVGLKRETENAADDPRAQTPLREEREEEGEEEPPPAKRDSFADQLMEKVSRKQVAPEGSSHTQMQTTPQEGKEEEAEEESPLAKRDSFADQLTEKASREKLAPEVEQEQERNVPPNLPSLSPGGVWTGGRKGSSWITPKSTDNPDEPSEKEPREEPGILTSPGRIPSARGKSWITPENNNNDIGEISKVKPQEEPGILSSPRRVSLVRGKSWISANDSSGSLEKAPQEEPGMLPLPGRVSSVRGKSWIQSAEDPVRAPRVTSSIRRPATHVGFSSESIPRQERKGEEGDDSDEKKTGRRKPGLESDSGPADLASKKGSFSRSRDRSFVTRRLASRDGASSRKNPQEPESTATPTDATAEDDAPPEKPTPLEPTKRVERVEKEVGMQEQVQDLPSLKQRMAAFQGGATFKEKPRPKPTPKGSSAGRKSWRSAKVAAGSAKEEPPEKTLPEKGEEQDEEEEKKKDGDGEEEQEQKQKPTSLKQYLAAYQSASREKKKEVDGEEDQQQKQKRTSRLTQYIAAYEGASRRTLLDYPQEPKGESPEDGGVDPSESSQKMSRPEPERKEEGAPSLSGGRKSWRGAKVATDAAVDEPPEKSPPGNDHEKDDSKEQQKEKDRKGTCSIKQRLAAYQSASSRPTLPRWKEERTVRENALAKGSAGKDDSASPPPKVVDAAPVVRMSFKERMAAYQGGGASSISSVEDDISSAASAPEEDDNSIDDTPISMKDRMAAFQRGKSSSMAPIEEVEEEPKVKDRILALKPTEERGSSLRDRMAAFGGAKSPSRSGTKKEPNGVRQRMSAFSPKSCPPSATSIEGKRPPPMVKVLPSGGESGGLKDLMAKYAETAGVAEMDGFVVAKKKTTAAKAKRRSFTAKKPKGDLQLRMQNYLATPDLPEGTEARAGPQGKKKVQGKWKYQAKAAVVEGKGNEKEAASPKERGKGGTSMFRGKKAESNEEQTAQANLPEQSDGGENEENPAETTSPRAPRRDIGARLSLYQANMVSPTNAVAAKEEQSAKAIPPGDLEGRLSAYKANVISPGASATVAEPIKISSSVGMQEKNLGSSDADSSSLLNSTKASRDDLQDERPLSIEISSLDGAAQEKETEADDLSSSAPISESRHGLEGRVSKPVDDSQKELDGSSSSTVATNNFAPPEQLGEDLRARKAKLAEESNLLQKKKCEEEERAKAELEELKSEMASAEKSLGDSLGLIQSLSVEVEKHEVSAKKAEMHVKAAEEEKKKKGGMRLGKGKKMKEYDKALEVLKTEQERVKEAKDKLAAAQQESETAQSKVEKCRKKSAKVELKMRKQILVAEEAVRQKKLEVERLQLALSRHEQKPQQVEEMDQ